MQIITLSILFVNEFKSFCSVLFILKLLFLIKKFQEYT